MIDGNVRDFIDKLYYEDHYILYNNEKYFFNGCQHQGKSDNREVSLEIYNLSKDETIFSVKKHTPEECIQEMEEAKIWNGQSFWEVEEKMIWVDD